MYNFASATAQPLSVNLIVRLHRGMTKTEFRPT